MVPIELAYGPVLCLEYPVGDVSRVPTACPAVTVRMPRYSIEIADGASRNDTEYASGIGEAAVLGALSGDTKVYIVTGCPDMRRIFDGLMIIIRDTYQMDPYADALYLFCGWKRNTLKALYFDQTGFVLCTKCLDNGKFQWSRNTLEVRQLTR